MGKFNVNDLLRKNIKNIKPYSSARDEYSGEANVYLDANENPYGAIGGAKYNRYPDPYQRELKKVISEIKNVPENQIFLGVGSDEAIDLLFKAFCYPGKDKAIITSPTYGMYEVSAATNDVQIVDIPLDKEFQPVVDNILEHGEENVKILFLCTPNNPTANLLEKDKIETLIREFDGIVIVDEAYIDFADTQSWSQRLVDFPNLVVIQTFSKAWGMANIRLGMMFASPEIIAIINKIKLPYNISGLVQDYAIETIKTHKAEKDEMVAEIKTERKKLVEKLKTIDYIKQIYPSDANFVLIKTDIPRDIYNYLLDQMIVVRDRSRVALCEGCIRITIGTADENATLMEALERYSL